MRAERRQKEAELLKNRFRNPKMKDKKSREIGLGWASSAHLNLGPVLSLAPSALVICQSKSTSAQFKLQFWSIFWPSSMG